MKRAKPNLKLYWVTTPDHDEDWFILARSKRQAERFHEDFEGYPRDYTHAELILTDVESKLSKLDEIPVHPQLEDLLALGFKEILKGDIRKICLGDRVFTEGALEALIQIARDNQFEAAGEGRPNGTVRPSTMVN